jgi:cysteinyl-tRNA synthetase
MKSTTRDGSPHHENLHAKKSALTSQQTMKTAMKVPRVHIVKEKFSQENKGDKWNRCC